MTTKELNAAITITNGDRRSPFLLQVVVNGEVILIPPGASRLVLVARDESLSVHACLPPKAEVSAQSFVGRAEAALHSVLADVDREGAELSDAAMLVYNDALDLLGLHPSDTGDPDGSSDPETGAKAPEDAPAAK